MGQAIVRAPCPPFSPVNIKKSKTEWCILFSNCRNELPCYYLFMSHKEFLWYIINVISSVFNCCETKHNTYKVVKKNLNCMGT